jgi:hypothetical protein
MSRNFDYAVLASLKQLAGDDSVVRNVIEQAHFTVNSEAAKDERAALEQGATALRTVDLLEKNLKAVRELRDARSEADMSAVRDLADQIEELVDRLTPDEPRAPSIAEVLGRPTEETAADDGDYWGSFSDRHS